MAAAPSSTGELSCRSAVADDLRKPGGVREGSPGFRASTDQEGRLPP